MASPRAQTPCTRQPVTVHPARAANALPNSATPLRPTGPSVQPSATIRARCVAQMPSREGFTLGSVEGRHHGDHIVLLHHEPIFHEQAMHRQRRPIVVCQLCLRDLYDRFVLLGQPVGPNLDAAAARQRTTAARQEGQLNAFLGKTPADSRLLTTGPRTRGTLP